jgi:hypothetical protein
MQLLEHCCGGAKEAYSGTVSMLYLRSSYYNAAEGNDV